MTTTGKVFAYINPDLKQYESNISNNVTSLLYTPFSISLPVKNMDAYRGIAVQLNAANGGEKFKTLKWTPSTLISCQNCLDPFFRSNTHTTVKAIGTTEYNCIDSASIDINVYYQQHIILPNVFTPDGDGKNDYFYVISGKDLVLVEQFQIFNRWGEKVFEKNNVRSNEYAGGWDGTYKGKRSAAGTYVYLIKVQLEDGTKEIYKGNITILR